MTKYVAIPMRCSAYGEAFQAFFEWDAVRKEYVFLEAVPLGPGSAGQGGSAEPGGEGRASAGGGPTTEFNLWQFNFHGYACPVCGSGRKHAPFTKGIHYVRCGCCRELMCAVRVREVEGELLFRCHNDCNGGGVLALPRPITVRGVSGEGAPSPGGTGQVAIAAAAAPSHAQVERRAAPALGSPPRKQIGR